MAKSILKSIGAILLGFIVGAALSIGTDVVLTKTGIMIGDPFRDNPGWLILIIIIYRFIFNATGCFITARTAPNKPMVHVLIIGIVGTILGIVGSVTMWDKAVAWYNVSIILISLPSAWLGGKLFILKHKQA